jgi:hypothetical protein
MKEMSEYSDGLCLVFKGEGEGSRDLGLTVRVSTQEHFPQDGATFEGV